jgi:hypothetical protein
MISFIIKMLHKIEIRFFSFSHVKQQVSVYMESILGRACLSDSSKTCIVISQCSKLAQQISNPKETLKGSEICKN